MLTAAQCLDNALLNTILYIDHICNIYWCIEKIFFNQFTVFGILRHGAFCTGILLLKESRC